MSSPPIPVHRESTFIGSGDAGAPGASEPRARRAPSEQERLLGAEPGEPLPLVQGHSGQHLRTRLDPGRAVLLVEVPGALVRREAHAYAPWPKGSRFRKTSSSEPAPLSTASTASATSDSSSCQRSE